NNFLENVDQVEAVDPDLIARLKAEVRVIRAYLYLKLVMLYGDVPLITQTVASISEGQEVTRTPVSEVWGFINRELEESTVDLPPVQTDKGRITKGAALALHARAFLYQGNYAQAAAKAKEVMDLGIYSLYPKYEELFDYP